MVYYSNAGYAFCWSREARLQAKLGCQEPIGNLGFCNGSSLYIFFSGLSLGIRLGLDSDVRALKSAGSVNHSALLGVGDTQRMAVAAATSNTLLSNCVFERPRNIGPPR